MDKRWGSIVALIGPPWKVIGRSSWMYAGTESPWSCVMWSGGPTGFFHVPFR